MIDRKARDAAANAVRRFYHGITTNDEFDGEYPKSQSTADGGITAIGTMVWNFYDDHRVHVIRKLAADERALFERCLAFLHSDLEYTWPQANFMRRGPSHPLLNAITFGWAHRQWKRADDAFMKSLAAVGDFAFWPFHNQHEYELTTKHAE